MTTIKHAAQDFLAQSSIAVVGVSRDREEAANFIYRRLKQSGHEVFAVNPNADTVEGDRCYATLQAVDRAIDGVVVVTKPQITDDIVRECASLKIPRVWMHHSMGNSVSPDAVAFCHANNITVIPGGCPMMFCKPVDFGHKCIKWFMNLTGKLPKQIRTTEP